MRSLHRLRPTAHTVGTAALLAAAVSSLVVAPPGIAPVGPTATRPAVYVAPPSFQPQIAAALAATRFPVFSPSIADPAALRAPEWWRDGCLNISVRNVARCVYGPTPATRELAVVGDSIATGWLPGLRIAAARHGWRLHVFTMQLCPTATVPTFLVSAAGGVNRTCDNHRRWMLEQVRLLRPFLVIASSGIDGPDHLYPRKTSDWPTTWANGMTTTLRVLAQNSHKVIVLPPPPASGPLSTCRRPADCVRPISTQWRQLYAAEHIAAKRAGVNVRHPDIRSWFCVSDRCPAFVGTMPVMADRSHLAAAYSRRLAAHLDSALNS